MVKAAHLNKQQGSIIVMFTIGLFVLIAMAALALDGGHLLLNKNRLQNYVDAAALSAAKTIDDGGDHAAAVTAAKTMMTINLSHLDAAEIANAIDLEDSSQFNVEFFLTPTDTTPSNLPAAEFVKVTASNLSLSNFLAQLFNFDKRVSATALAGASTAIEYCFNDLVPMMVCGTPSATVPAPDDYMFGYTSGEMQVMKMDSSPDSQIGPGNFQLIRLGDAHGANEIRNAMAGGDDDNANICFSAGSDEPDVSTTSEVPTEPGNTVGPVAQGLNTRLGIYHGPMKKDSNLYPRDVNNCQGERVELDGDGQPFIKGSPDDILFSDPEFYNNIYTFTEYDSDIGSGSCALPNTAGNIDASGAAGRRIIRVVVGDCSGEANGANNVEFLGVACFFLTQETTQKGNESYVFGEFIENCTGNGWPSGNTQGNGPHTLVLYHVPDSNDS
mgnify:CR=1 FL=1